ncbi:hypothetical protein PLESTB_000340600 [Pleodorina starrii]|uniref:Uncharacterized protein n=1 Tax=Pleodorina starrii TaxID=330485 RepID=A0A9W6EZG1_9CHLO|nr:hypothetical protein PLESTB_000340600 [Pleodorina starrii]
MKLSPTPSRAAGQHASGLPAAAEEAVVDTSTKASIEARARRWRHGHPPLRLSRRLAASSSLPVLQRRAPKLHLTEALATAAATTDLTSVISAATPSGIHAGPATVPGSSSFVMVLPVHFGSFLGGWADQFDATAFGISPTEALELQDHAMTATAFSVTARLISGCTTTRSHGQCRGRHAARRRAGGADPWLASGGGRGTGGARGLEACGGSAVPAHRRLGCGAWRDCERFLVKHFDLSVDFAVEDALPRLEQWGLVRRLVQKGPGKLKFEAVHVETAALALQEIWQKSFAALAAPPETATFPLSNLISGQERAPATNQDSLFRAATSGATATAAEQDAAAAAAGPAASAAAAAPATPPLKPSSSTATSAAAAKTSSGGGGGGGGGGGLFSFCDWLVATRVLLVGGFSHISGRSGGVGGGGRGRGFFFTGAPPGACVPDAWPGAETREGRAAGGSSDGSALPGLQECRWGVPYATISHGLLDAICKRVGCKGAFCEDPGGGKRGVLQLLAKRRQAECMEDECPTD